MQIRRTHGQQHVALAAHSGCSDRQVAVASADMAHAQVATCGCSCTQAAVASSRQVAGGRSIMQIRHTQVATCYMWL